MIEQFISQHVLTWQHLPFIAVMVVYAIIGRYMSKHVWTRQRAYRKGRFQGFFWHMRETQILHPIITAAPIGLAWPDPEGHGWDWRGGISYFAFAGACSLIFWLLMKIWAKRKGIKLAFPGESERPTK